jgi:hypothetical protein
MKRSLRQLLCAAVIAIAGVSSLALARPTKIALTKIDGDASDLGKAVIAALDDSDLSIVTSKQVGRTSDLLGLDDRLSDRDVEKLAAQLDVDAVIKGTFDRRAHRLRFTIFANGKKGKSFSIQVSDASSDTFRKQVRATVVTKLAEAVPPDSEVADDTDAADEDARSKQPSRKAGKLSRKAEGDARTEVADDSAKKPARSKAKGKLKDGDELAAEVADDSAKKPARSKAKGKVKDGDELAAEVADDSAKKPARSKAKGKVKDGDDEAAEVADDSAKKPARSKAKGKVKDGDDAAAEVADDSAKKPARSKAKGKVKDGDDAAAEVADDSAKKPARSKAKETDAAIAAVTPPAEDASSEPPEAEGDVPRTATKQVAAGEEEEEEATPSAHARLAPSTRDPVHSANLVAVRVDLGSSLSARDLRFQTTAFANAPKPYRNAPVPGARFEGELYPFAFQDPSSFLAGLGVAGDFDQVVALTLHASTEMNVPLKTTDRHYSVGLRYRIAFGHAPTSPTLTLGGGYGARTFVVSRSGLMSSASFDLPDVDYKLYDPGLAFRLPLGGKVAVTLGGRALLVTAAGRIQNADQYGRAKIFGGTASAGLEFVMGDRVALRVAGEATQLAFQFAGTGALATSRDGDASTVDVRGAIDRYYGGAATLAILY